MSFDFHFEQPRMDVSFGEQIARDIIFSKDYNLLENKPTINGVELSGDKTSEEFGIDRTYVHMQSVASAEWIIEHNLNKYPSVIIVDSSGNVVIGDVEYVNSNVVICTFSGAFSGIAYLN